MSSSNSHAEKHSLPGEAHPDDLGPLTKDDMQIVVAHYSEAAVSEFQPFVDQTTIYTKSPDGTIPMPWPEAQLVHLTNIGREGHTFLHHIVQNFDNLPKVTIFIQADPFDHLAPGTTLESIVEQALAPTTNGVTTFHPHGFRIFTDWDGFLWGKDWEQKPWFDKCGGTMKRASYNPGEFWRRLTGEQHPKTVWYMAGATFAARRSALQRRGKGVWERALKAFNDPAHVNPEEGQYLERCWVALLSDDYLARGEKTDNDGKERADVHAAAMKSIVGLAVEKAVDKLAEGIVAQIKPTLTEAIEQCVTRAALKKDEQ